MSSIAFLISNRYQIHHFAPIAAHLDDVTFVVEHRDVDFGVTEELITRHVHGARVEHTTYRRLKDIDGSYAAIVCQTPVLPNRLLERSLVVAQQYSLAKENYQYGLWRSLCDLNLMYGPYSTGRVDGFCSALAVGNPALDSILGRAGSERPLGKSSTSLRGLYMPTYGSLSSVAEILPRLASADAEFTLKLHHASERSEIPRVPDNCRVVSADTPLSDVLRTADFVVSDYSGAAYDALIVGLPVLLVGRATAADDDQRQLSASEVDGEALGHVTARWEQDQPVSDALAIAASRLSEHRGELLRTRLSNPGAAGEAAAIALRELVERGHGRHPAPQVRSETAAMMRTARDLAADNRRLRRQNDNLRSPSARRLHRVVTPAIARFRVLVARTPRLERTLVALRHRVRGTDDRHDVPESSAGSAHGCRR